MPTQDSPPLDRAVFVRAIERDEHAMREVARAWWPAMRRWSLIELGNRPAAEDASQDALVRLIENIDRYDPDRPFGPWLRTLVRNVCRNHRRAIRPDPVPREDAPGPSVDRGLDLRRAAGRLVDAFLDLSARQRALVELCDLQGATPAEAAEELGIEASTARVHLHRARRTLRAGLGDDHDELQDLVRNR
ncbi:MAG: sigma-70 family RNA polymerase sigma factor [Myxococcota bacterium]